MALPSILTLVITKIKITKRIYEDTHLGITAMQVLNKSIFGLRSPLRRIIQIDNRVKHLHGSCNEYKTKAIDSCRPMNGRLMAV